MRRFWLIAQRWWRRGLAAGVASIVVFGLWVRLGPLPRGFLDIATATSTVVVDRHGERLHEVRSATGLRGDWIEAREVPATVRDATLAAEDIRFDVHPGVDPIAVTRAAWRNVRYGEIAEGGSTITQQVVKLLLTHHAGGAAPSGWRAKAWEAVLALRLEHRLEKDTILALYLSLAPYGNQIQGVRRAATAYFGRDVSTLTRAEVAFLAALPQQPSRFNPWRDPRRAVARQARILDTMVAHGWMSDADRRLARTETLQLTHDAPASVAPHFVERVLGELGSARPRRVETTLDAALQRSVQGIIGAQRASLQQHQADHVAVAVFDNRTGEWLAWEGSGGYFDAPRGGTIDGVTAPRQPGSALKPFTYAAAFERGWHPGRVLADVPSEFPTAEAGVMYSPRNYDGQFRGPLLARQALAGSENVPAVALASAIGVPALARTLRQAGLTTLERNASHYGLGLTLGNAEVRLDELVAAYSMLARGGERLSPVMVRTIDGAAPPARTRTRVISERSAFWVTDILSDNEAREYIFGRGGSLEFPFPVAVKTGTSQSYFDNWAVGYTTDVTVGVWVGNFDRRPLRGSSGVTGAGPIFHAVMLAAVEHVRGAVPVGETTPIRDTPADVAREEICAVSGGVAGDACPTRRTEWLPVGAHTPACDWHVSTPTGVVTRWPAAYHSWARAKGLLTAADVRATTAVIGARAPSSGHASTARRSPESFRIARPLGGAVFLIDASLRPEFQTLAFEAVGAAPGRVTWSVNGEAIGASDGLTPLRWPLRRGRHVIEAVDQAGRRTSTSIEVR